ncbi:hypothetical protein NC651_028634 [Populus alba x Populus x berolinensis]|nr:hypothetical protein NC651_028634 [Populus alba x Populus x berolinensis]
MGESCIPTVDLSPCFREDDEVGMKKAKEIIGQACSEYGFFQVVNHGVPLGLMTRAIELSKTFFETLPIEEKLKCAPNSGAPLPAGYNRQPDQSPDKNEYLLMFPPGSNLNGGIGTDIRLLYKAGCSYREHIKPVFRSPFHLPRGIQWRQEHEDGNCITFVFQDEAGGLEVRRNGKWIPVIPTRGSLVVNVGDVIQVLSNNNFKSATHRVVRPKSKSRYSYAFFYNLHGDKWVEPLQQFTKDIGEAPKYRGFRYKEYQELRMRNKTHPPSTPEDVIRITHYAVNTS